MMSRGVLVFAGSCVLVACSSSEKAPTPGEPVASSSEAITTSDVIARAKQWVDAKLLYCQAPNHQHDYDTACSSTCNRQDNPDWDPYRSDCSGFVSWAWGLPAPGRVTSQFAPANTQVSHVIQGADLQPGDALNYPADHMILFVKWITPGVEAEFYEEPGCGVSIPYAHAFTSKVSINGSSVYVSYEGMTFSAIRYNQIQAGSPRIVHRNAVDINGDGKSDICGRAAAGIVCQIDGAQVSGPAWSDANGWDQPQYYDTIQFADVDGDGRGDLCARDSTGIVCELSTGNGFATEIRGPGWSDAGNWNNVQYYSTIQFADVNGDGKADVCGRAAAGIVCSLSDGTGFTKDITGPAWSDVNGWAPPQYQSTIRFGDVNGDGKADVCGRAIAGIVCNLSDGNGFPTEIQGPAWSDANGWANSQFYSTIQLADIDGDGKQDLCARSSASVICNLSNGTGFPTEVVGPGWSSSGGWDDAQYDSTLGFADIDDDGKDDVCARGWDGVFCALSTGTGFADAKLGPAWSNPNGWGVEKYYGTLRYGGAKQKKVTPPNPVTDAGSGNTKDGGTNGDTGGGGGGGCSVSSTSSGNAAWVLLAIAMTVTVTGLRRRRR